MSTNEDTQNEHARSFMEAVREGNVQHVRELLSVYSPTSSERQSALIWASTNGHAAVLKQLIEVSDIQRGDIFATLLRNAEVYEHAECLEVLLPYIPNFHHNSAHVFDELFVSAATNKTESSLKVLLPYVDPKANHSAALKRAIEGKHTACIEFLIPVSDTHGIDATQQLLEAVETKEAHCVEVLLPLCSRLHETNVLTEIIRHRRHPENLLAMVAPFCNPSHNDSEALFFAVRQELTKSVAVLAQVCDVSAAHSRALALAEEKDLKAICELLYDGSDLDAAWETLNERLSWLKPEDVDEYKQHKHPRLYQLRQQHMLATVALNAQKERLEQRRNSDDGNAAISEEPKRRKI